MATSETSGVAERYAIALFELARERSQLQQIEQSVSELSQMIEASDDLQRMLKSPVIKVEDQIRALLAVMKAHVSEETVLNNAVQIVARNRRLFALPGILKAFLKMAAKERGETVAVVTSAEPLSDSNLDALRQVLAEKAGGSVILETHVDPTLIGGLIVQLGSQMIDTSVRTRLIGLRQAMKEAA